MPENSLVFVNTKLKGSPMIEHLQQEGVAARYAPIKLVDVMVGGRFGIVVRSIDDFLADLANKSVYRTAPELKRSFSDPIYIVEGLTPGAKVSASTTGRAGITYLVIVNRIPVLFTSSCEETARYISLISKQVSFAAASELAAETTAGADNGSDSRVDPEVAVLKMLPGISEDNAIALLKHFGSLKGISSAGESALRKVRGMGPKKAKTLFEILNRDWTAASRKNPQKSGSPVSAR